MKQIPQITDAEFSVMKVIWEKGKCTSSEIVEEISKNSDWKPKTIQTLIGRLVSKEAIGAEKSDSKAFVYHALVSKKEYIKNENRNFINKLYDGSLNMMLASFVKDKKLSDKEIENLKSILEGKDI